MVSGRAADKRRVVEEARLKEQLAERCLQQSFTALHTPAHSRQGSLVHSFAAQSPFYLRLGPMF